MANRPLRHSAEARAPHTSDYALLIVLAAIWGSSFMIIKVAVHDVPAATLTAFRLGIAAVLLAGIMTHARQSLPRGWTVWGWITLAAIFGNALPFTLISWGEVAIKAGLAAILMAVMPLTTLVLAHVVTSDEKLNARKAIGVCLGLAGLMVLIGPEKLARLGDDSIRQLAVAGAAVCYGISALIAKSLMHLPRKALAAAILAISTLIMVPFSLAIDQPWQLQPGGAAILAVIVLGLLQTAIATLIMFALISRQGATFFSQINFLVPLFGVAWGVLILGEAVGLAAMAALGLILVGIAIAR